MIYGVLLVIFSAVIIALIILTGLIFEREELKMEEKLYALYKNDEDFKDYVDRYCTKHNINIFEAFDHRMIRIVAKEKMNK